MLSKHFDTAAKRFRKAVYAANKFGWSIIEEHPGRFVRCQKKSRFLNIEGMITVDYDAVTMEFTSELEHDKRGRTRLKRTVTTKRMLRNLFAYPRTHTGLKGTYIEPLCR